jgi:hypothetical protein
MRSQIRYTPDGIALYLDIRGEHLSNKRFQSPQSNNQEFIFRY